MQNNKQFILGCEITYNYTGVYRVSQYSHPYQSMEIASTVELQNKSGPLTDNGQGLDNNLLEGNPFLARIRAALTDRHYYISIFDQHNQYATAYSTYDIAKTV